MKMLLSISWRNIWRRPSRSGVLIGAVIAGLWAGILVSSWTNGLINQRINRVIQEELTHLQIHHPEFLADREPQMTIEPAHEIFSFLNNDERIKSYAARTLADGMIQSPQTASGVQITGVMADLEPATTNFHENLIEGSYLTEEIVYPIIIGVKLAEKLNIGVGNRVVLSFQDLQNDIVYNAFNVAGIFRANLPAYDEARVIVRAEDLYGLMAGTPVFHEIAIMLYDIDESDQVAADINRQFDTIQAETWMELSPELRFMTGASEYYMFYIMVVIMLALAFGILNTMLMAIFERTRELGMLISIGMSRSRVFIMIILESVILTMAGGAAGILISILTVSYLGRNGLDLSSIGGDTMAEWGYDAFVYPFITTGEYISVAVLVMITAILAAIYPAIKALRLNPGDVIRE